MNFYADTSFLVSLYGRDSNSPAAISLVKSRRPIFLLTPFGEAEFLNACELRVFLKDWTATAARAVRNDFLSDIPAGVFQTEELGREVWQTAVRLSRRYTAKLQFELDLWADFERAGTESEDYARRLTASIGMVYRPLRFVPLAILLSLIAVGIGGRNAKLAGYALLICAGCFVIGMAAAVITSHPLW